MGATFSCSDGLDKIELARLGSQGCRPVLDHSPVENPLHRRRRVSQDPTLQGGVRAGDGVHPRLHHHHLITMMMTRRRRRRLMINNDDDDDDDKGEKEEEVDDQ